MIKHSNCHRGTNWPGPSSCCWRLSPLPATCQLPDQTRPATASKCQTAGGRLLPQVTPVLWRTSCPWRYLRHQSEPLHPWSSHPAAPRTWEVQLSGGRTPGSGTAYIFPKLPIPHLHSLIHRLHLRTVLTLLWALRETEVWCVTHMCAWQSHFS